MPIDDEKLERAKKGLKEVASLVVARRADSRQLQIGKLGEEIKLLRSLGVSFKTIAEKLVSLDVFEFGVSSDDIRRFCRESLQEKPSRRRKRVPRKKRILREGESNLSKKSGRTIPRMQGFRVAQSTDEL